jgi:hypothetical protein
MGMLVLLRGAGSWRVWVREFTRHMGFIEKLIVFLQGFSAGCLLWHLYRICSPFVYTTSSPRILQSEVGNISFVMIGPLGVELVKGAVLGSEGRIPVVEFPFL